MRDDRHEVEPKGDDVLPGDCVADRYHLVRRLGRGSFGEVWEAQDGITHRSVAVKLLHSSVDLAPAYAQIEVTALRLRLPGVVGLLDSGVHRARAFIVIELVDGRPFPARSGPCTWDDIAPVTVALLETLARVHGEFIVHCDLKPENVLVTPAGQVFLLDFGIAYQQALGSIDQGTGLVLGTPAYMAPEQVQSRPVDERTDLYALGVMLYHALSGAMPHDGASSPIFAKVNLRATALYEVAPHVPQRVARLVDRLIERRPRDRPRSVFEVLAVLRGDASVTAPLLPWIGSQATINAVIAAAREGRSIDIVGPRGSGRTRHLLAVEESLARERRVLWVPPAERAFESLAALFDVRHPPASDPAGDTVAACEEQVRRSLSEGAVLLVDDVPQIDPSSAEILMRVRDAGAVIRATDSPAKDGIPFVTLRSPSEVDLRSLFAGPDRLLHLREDAARLLFQSTGGLPARVVREIMSWMDLGIARPVRNLIAVSREGLARLAIGPPMGAPADVDAGPLRGLPPEQGDLLVWCALAWPHATAGLLSTVMAEPLHRIEELLASLAERELVRVSPGGTVLPQAPAPLGSWTEARARRAHTAIARTLAPGVPGRLRHLVAAGVRTAEEHGALAREAATLAARLIDDGYLSDAVSALETGLRALRPYAQDAAKEVGQLLSLWVETAFEDDNPRHRDRVLYELCRARPRTTLVARLQHLMRAIASEDVRGHALEILDGVPPFEDVRLERVRLGALAAAVRKLEDDTMEARIMAEVARSPFAGDAEIGARLAHWRGRVRYLWGQFREAARLHSEAARSAASVPVRISAMIAGAYSLLEAFELDEARFLAEEACALAAEHRHAFQEATAQWTLRTIAYRKGTASAPDAALVQAIPYAAGRLFQGAVLLTESAVAWRAGLLVEARELAGRGYAVLSEIHAFRGASLLHAFLAALGRDIDRPDIDVLCAHALASPTPSIGIQILALLAIAGKLPAGAADEAAIWRLAELSPRASWAMRSDILSLDECLSVLLGPPGLAARG